MGEGIAVVKVEQCGKHYKGESGYYRIPCIFHLADGQKVESYISGQRLGDAKKVLENYQHVGGCVGRYIEVIGGVIVHHYDHGEWVDWHKARQQKSGV